MASAYRTQCAITTAVSRNRSAARARTNARREWLDRRAAHRVQPRTTCPDCSGSPDHRPTDELGCRSTPPLPRRPRQLQPARRLSAPTHMPSRGPRPARVCRLTREPCRARSAIQRALAPLAHRQTPSPPRPLQQRRPGARRRTTSPNGEVARPPEQIVRYVRSAPVDMGGYLAAPAMKADTM